MSLLRSFAGNLFSGIGNEMQRNEDIQLQMAIEERRERMREQRRQRERSEGMEDAVTMRNLDADPRVIQRVSPEGGLQNIQVQDSYRMDGGRPVREQKELGVMPPKPLRGLLKFQDGANNVAYQEYDDGTRKLLGSGPAHAAGGGGRPIQAKTMDFPGADGSTEKWQVDPYTLAQIRLISTTPAAAPSAATTDAARSRYLTDLGRIEKAETAEQLATLAKSAGVRLPGRTELGDGAMDESKWLPEAKKIVAAGFQKRFEGQQAPSGATKKKGASQDNPANAADFSGDPPSGTWVRLPSGKVIQVP